MMSDIFSPDSLSGCCLIRPPPGGHRALDTANCSCEVFIPCARSRDLKIVSVRSRFHLGKAGGSASTCTPQVFTAPRRLRFLPCSLGLGCDWARESRRHLVYLLL